MYFSIPKRVGNLGVGMRVVVQSSFAAYSPYKYLSTVDLPIPTSPRAAHVSPCRLLIVKRALASTPFRDGVIYKLLGFGEMLNGVVSSLGIATIVGRYITEEGSETMIIFGLIGGFCVNLCRI